MQDLYLQLEILWPAMIAGLLVLATHVPLGREVLNRGIIFLDLAIAQTAAFGVVLANTIWFGEHNHAHVHVPPTLIAIIAATLGSFALYSIRKFAVHIQESFIGILFVLMATGIILLLSTDPHGGERLKEILVGQILWLQTEDLIRLAAASAATLFTWFYLRKRLRDWIFYPVFAITITLSTQIVGVYLVFASLIIPSLSVLNQTNPMIKAYIVGAIGYASGLTLSAWLDLPAGATIVWNLAIIGALYHFIATDWIKSNSQH